MDDKAEFEWAVQGLRAWLWREFEQAAELNPHAQATTRPLAVPVDILELCNAKPELGMFVWQHTEACRLGLTQLLQEEGCLPPGSRLWLRLTAGIGHHDTLDDLQTAATRYGNHTASVCGIIQAFTVPILKPDITDGTLFPVQSIWLGPLHTSAVPGSSPYTTSIQSMQVRLQDDLCNHPLVRLGAAVTIVGQTQCYSEPCRGAKHVSLATISMHALNVLPADLFAQWQPIAPPLLHSSYLDHPAPLHAMYNELMDAQGCYIGPMLSVAMLISAAMAGAGMQQLRERQVSYARSGKHIAPTATSSQCSVSVLVTHSATDPAAIRALRSTAALLCPVSYAPSGPGQLSDLLLPRLERLKSYTDTATAEGALMVQGSLATACNSGVLVLDAPVVLTNSKARAQQLAHVMSSGGVLPLGKPGSQVLVPQTATIWCAAEMSNSDKIDASLPWDKFSLVVAEATDEALTVWCALEAGSDARSGAGLAAISAHAARLSSHMALVAKTPCQPRLSGEAEALLIAYFHSIRNDQGATTIPMDTLNTLIACAMGCARLMLRSKVLAHPDCTVAIALMEETLEQRHKKVGWVNLQLGPKLAGGLGAVLDEQLLDVHKSIMKELQPYISKQDDGADGPSLSSSVNLE